MNNNQIGRYVEATAKSLLIDSKYSDDVICITYIDKAKNKLINILDESAIYILFKNNKIETVYLKDYDENHDKKIAVLSAVLNKIVSVIDEE